LSEDVSLERIRHARGVVADVVRETQVIESRYLSRTTGGTIALKAENLQRTGSFKLRGALNKIATLGPDVNGVVTASAGNHGQSVAYAARARGLKATIFMPERAALAKIAAARESGAEIVLGGDSMETCLGPARERGESENLAFVHPYDDPAVIAGQGTIGLELLDQVPDLAEVLIPLGGGGLTAGVAAAIRRAATGSRSSIQARATLADGIAVKSPGEITKPLSTGSSIGPSRWARRRSPTRSCCSRSGPSWSSRAPAPSGWRRSARASWSRRIGYDRRDPLGGNIDTGVLADIARHHETARAGGCGSSPRSPTSRDRWRHCHPARRRRRQPDRRRPRPRAWAAVGETGVELVMETRGPEHAERLLG
jgi:threonine dehydratase